MKKIKLKNKLAHGNRPAIFRVFTPNETVVIKGFYNPTVDFIKNNLPFSVYHATVFFKNNRKSSLWGSPLKIYFGKFSRNFSKKNIPNCNRATRYIEITTQTGRKTLLVRRIPRKWIRAYDDAIPR